MKVVFHSPQNISSRRFHKGEHVVSDSFAHDLGFKKLVASGEAQVLPRDAFAQSMQISKDAEAADRARLAAHPNSHPSARGTSSAPTSQSSVPGSDQALPTPATPILAGVAVPASEPASPATAPKKRKEKA